MEKEGDELNQLKRGQVPKKVNILVIRQSLRTGRFFGRTSQKGPNKKWSGGRTILLPNFWPILNKKGPKMGRMLTQLFPSSYPL